MQRWRRERNRNEIQIQYNIQLQIRAYLFSIASFVYSPLFSFCYHYHFSSFILSPGSLGFASSYFISFHHFTIFSQSSCISVQCSCFMEAISLSCVFNSLCNFFLQNRSKSALCFSCPSSTFSFSCSSSFSSNSFFFSLSFCHSYSSSPQILSLFIPFRWQ